MAPDLPPNLLAVIRKALQKKPADRYSTAGEMAAELQAIRLSIAPVGDMPLDDIGVPATTVEEPVARTREPAGEVPISSRPVHQAVPKSPRSHLWLSTAFGAVFVAVVLLVFLGLGIWRRTPPAPTSQKEIPPPPPPPITLRIESEPAGASIALSGTKSAHMTPASIPFERDSIPVVTISKEGFLPKEIQPTEADLATGLITVKLIPKPKPEGYVEIAAGDDYEFQVDDPPGNLSAPGKTQKVFAKGARSVRLYAPEVYLDRTMRIEPGRGAYSTPRLGQLRVTARQEGCPIVLDDVWEVFAPKVYSLVEGGHVLVQQCPGSAPQRRAVNIVPGQMGAVSF